MGGVHCGNRRGIMVHVSLVESTVPFLNCIYEQNGNPEHVFATCRKLASAGTCFFTGKKVKEENLSQDISMFFLSFNSSYATIHTCVINEQVRNNIFILEFLENVTLNN